MLRKLITPIYLRGGKAVVSLTDASVFGDGDAVRLAEERRLEATRLQLQAADALLPKDCEQGVWVAGE